jgi:formamidopyrimidine-DNA glycosylase
MPELPEVETIVCELCPLTVGRRITDVEVLWPGSIAGLSPEEFAARLVGKTIDGLTRRAKFLLFHLTGGDVLLVHLRMTGRLVLRSREAEEERFAKVIIGLEGDEELRFTDIRKFGRLQLAAAEEVVDLLGGLGPEPLAEEFGVADLKRALGRRKAPLKSLLLNQTLLAGVGNIYADEALFLAGLKPQRRPESLSEAEWQSLHAGIRRALAEGIEDRGTTFSDFRDGHGRPGNHQESLSVYRRTGQACPRCGGTIERIVISGRSTHFCPGCQK